MTRRFPFIGLPAALVLARVMTALFFMAHAIVRVANGSMLQFARFLEGQGFPAGLVLVWAITVVEIAAGIGLLLGRQVRLAAAALLAIALGGIVLIHRHNGWFVGEHGTGGSEYSVALIILLLVVAAADGERRR